MTVKVDPGDPSDDVEVCTPADVNALIDAKLAGLLISRSSLAADVQASLAKADTALQPSAPPPVDPPPAGPVPTGVPGSWVLAFEDNFNGTALDTTKWRQLGWNTNNIASSMANVAVVNGNLVLTLANSTSGAILTTQPGGSTAGFKIGVDPATPTQPATECVWEARILFPGDGSHIYGWPAFWLLNDTPGDVLCEIDIAEPWDGVMQSNYHCSGSNPSKSYTGYRDGQFHVWTLRRTATTMYFYVDGVLVYTLPKAAADNGHPQYCIINTGRTSSGLYNVYGAASQVKVDYVRAWKSA